MADGAHFTWNELMTRDVEAARTFYKELLGWTYYEKDMGEGDNYTVFLSGSKEVAGLFDINDKQFDGIPNHWFAYISVTDVDAAVVKVEASGGKVLRPCFDVPEVGRIAVIADSTGAAVGIYTQAAPG
ncbi:MAG: VOC family protein [Rhodospirillales bacterium]|nr:VOC family protein [Rhodospirillales bacterium]